MNKRVLFCMTLIATFGATHALASIETGEMRRQVIINKSDDNLAWASKTAAKGKLPCGRDAVYAGGLTAKANALGKEQLRQLTNERQLPGKVSGESAL